MSSVAERLQKKPARKSSDKQVRLKLVYVDFWSALKLSFFGALFIGIVTVVIIALLWIVLNQMNIFTELDGILQDIFNQPDFSIAKNFSFQAVMTFAAIVGVLNVVVYTVLGAIIAGVYNMFVKITGGQLVGFTNA